MSRIIVVEDHDRLANLIVKKLASAGIAADVFDRNAIAWLAIQQISYQALILDRGLPDGDGLNLLRRLRDNRIDIPCLILTARDALHDRIDGLETGADDYLSKPFAMDELLARVRAILRRPPISEALEPIYGDLQIKPSSSSMCCSHESIGLAPAELQIMLQLVHKQGGIVRHQSLETAGWGFESVTPNALDVAIHRLRKKLSAISSSMKIINLRNLGYVLREKDSDE